MNIHTAAHYLKIGYYIRRSSWELEEYLKEDNGLLEKGEIYYSNDYNKKTKSFETQPRLGISNVNVIKLSDLLADDWEIITNSIRKPFVS
jgi:hypothetical protein